MTTIGIDLTEYNEEELYWALEDCCIEDLLILAEQDMDSRSLAMVELAERFRDGDYENCVERDLEQSFYWYEKAAECGHTFAMFNTGLYYAKGAGVARDYEQAAAWMKKVEAAGDDDAQGLAVFYENAAKLEAMAKAGDPQAQGDYAWALMEIAKSMGDTYFDEKNFYESIEWARKAEPFNIDSAMWVLATTYFSGRGDIDPDNEKALMYYEKGAALGHAGCIYNVACYYMEGDIYPMDQEKGFSLIKEAAEKGFLNAMLHLADAYRKGWGTTQDIKAEAIWKRKGRESRQPYHLYVLSCLKSLQ